MSAIRPVPDAPFDLTCDVAVIGAGACGLTAGLRALEAGADVIVLERDASPSGSTALSSGFVPAPGTRFQAARGIADDPERFAEDIQAKAAGGADPEIVATVTHAIGPALEWLADRHGLEWEVLDGFLYPGHRIHRMHTVPERTGAALMGRLLTAAERSGLTLVTDAHVTALFADAAGRVAGLEITRPDGRTETLGLKALILACNGYGGNPDLVAAHIPEMAKAPYYGHAGNQGDALVWGEALGAAARDLTAYQGHGSLAHPHNILITWALMMEGGIQVNREGRRFSNEHAGYSEQAQKVLQQPDGIAYAVYDAPLHRRGLEFPDYREAVAAGAILTADDPASLEHACALPAGSLQATLEELRALSDADPDRRIDTFGRDFSGWKPFVSPLHAVRVTGAVFHTQGGLAVDDKARVKTRDGGVLPNLYAAGGAACGVSGARVEGYLSGNGLLTAIGLGFVAGKAAAGSTRSDPA